MTDLFQKDYVEFDQYGLKEVRCMACSLPIKTRMEEVSRLDPSRIIYVVGKHPNYKEIPVLLTNEKSCVFLMFCDGCQDISIEDNALPLSLLIERGWKLKYEAEGKAKDFIAALTDNAREDKRILRRLTPQEIKQRFGGEK